MTKDEARKELLETLEEYCHDKGYNLQVFAGMADWVYTLYPKKKTVTKAEYIRSLSDDDLAKFVRNISLSGCAVCAYVEHCSYDGVEEDFCLLGVEQWLKQEYKENNND